ncbi:hypothetical protein WN51_14000 [Melipona quadrifasciata]|uniref:Uncharacterized protein n=1 Tax=Melipona quadrifasciata TaxID=166423 RepID=A0A0N0BG21_9HYME|nr:hypothetical protein WN51_14000 [Melipona quadrifasciata]
MLQRFNNSNVAKLRTEPLQNNLNMLVDYLRSGKHPSDGYEIVTRFYGSIIFRDPDFTREHFEDIEKTARLVAQITSNKFLCELVFLKGFFGIPEKCFTCHK